MRRFMVSLTMGIMVLTWGTARATIIDDFSADSSAKYTVTPSWLNPGASAASYGLNASNQFAPTPNGTGGATTLFLRNDGYTFDVGDTISVDVCGVPSLYQTGGLVLSPSLTDSTGHFEYYVQNRWDIGPGVYGFDNPSIYNNFIYDLDLTAGPVNISLTRTSQTTLNIVYTYHTTTGGIATVSGTNIPLAAGTYYFGMGGYDNASAGQAMDNLSHSAVPEPSLMALAASGLLGLFAYAWRKRR